MCWFQDPLQAVLGGWPLQQGQLVKPHTGDAWGLSEVISGETLVSRQLPVVRLCPRCHCSKGS